MVNEHFKNNPGEQVVYTTPDGNLFTAKNKNNAIYHANRTGQKVEEHFNPDFKPETPAEDVKAEDKNLGNIDRGLSGLSFKELQAKALELGVTEEELAKLNSKAKVLAHLESIK